MSASARLRRPLARTLAIAATATVLLTTAFATGASAHGGVTDPPMRNYKCLDDWRNNHLAPEMATEDQMCYQAFQKNANTMWNWNGLYRENVGGRHQAVIPNGTLCSGGNTQGGLYSSLDAVGPWNMTDKSNQFTLTLTDGATHGADYLQIYITKQGFDALTQPLGWDDLELVVETPRIAPGGVYTVPVDAGSRSSRHIVYTIWQASHLDQPYYMCSDVNFTG